MDREEGTEPAGEAVQQVQQLTLAKRFDDWFDDYWHYLSAEGGQKLKQLIQEVRQLERPVSSHPLTYTGDIEVFASMFPATASRLRAEYHRLQLLLENKMDKTTSMREEAVPCKTVIVYGDHGPEEREPVEEYYEAPPPKPADEAVAWQVRLVVTDGGAGYDWRQTTREDYELSTPSEGTGARLEYRALYTAPPSDVLRRVVEALETARDYISSELQQEREALKGYEHCSNIAGIESDLAQNDAALAAAHKALAEGVGRDR